MKIILILFIISQTICAIFMWHYCAFNLARNENISKFEAERKIKNYIRKVLKLW